MKMSNDNEKQIENEANEECIVEEEKKLKEKKNSKNPKESKEYIELFNQYVRMQADFDNYRKRNNMLASEKYADGLKDAFLSILAVLDNLQRAIGVCEEGAFKEGLLNIERQFLDILKQYGIEEIKAEGEMFNEKYHNAIMRQKNEEFEANKIICVALKGYMYKDKVLRYSNVIVSE